MRSPMTPGSPSSGANAAIVVSTPQAAGRSTSRTPRAAASPMPPDIPPDIPPDWAAMCRCTFSPTTIASSTTIPSVMMNANSVIMFTVAPSPGISRKAPKNATGSPAAVQTASRLDRVKKSTRKISASPCRPLRTSNSTRLSNTSELSYQVVNESPAGRTEARRRTSARTARAVSPTRPPAASPTWRNAAGSPFMRAVRATSAKPSRTAAMSPTRTTPPPGRAITGMRANSAAPAASASVPTRSSPAAVRMTPPGMSVEPRRIASAT